MGGSLLPKKKSSYLVHGLATAGSLVSILTLLQTTGFGVSWILNTSFGLQLPADLTFNVAGSPFVAAQLLGVSLITLVAWIVTKKEFPKHIFLTGPLLIIGLILNTWVSLPGKIATPLMLPLTASWSITLDILRTPRAALIGVGPEYFVNAYNLFKPAWINGQQWWGVLFSQATNVPLTLLATTGFAGFISWALLAWNGSKYLKQRADADVFIPAVSLTIMFVLHLFFAANIVLLLIMAIALAFLLSAITEKDVQLQTFAIKFGDSHTKKSQIQPIASFVIGLVGVFIFFSTAYLVGRAYLASYYMFQSYTALQENDGVRVYDLQRNAISLNQYVDHYRRNYANTNMQIAIALSNKANASEEEQAQVAQLIQQAIREARAATVLNPINTQNWHTLAQIYKNLIGVAEDAPQWAVSAYARAIETDPINPNLRIELGGLFYGQGSYTQAVSLFQQAAELKPDLANAYYNMANALVQLNQLEQAKLAYQKTLVLIEPDSDAYLRASQELEQVEQKLKEQATQTENQQKQPAGQTVPSILDQTVTQPETSLLEQQIKDQELRGQFDPNAQNQEDMRDTDFNQIEENISPTTNQEQETEPTEATQESELDQYNY